MKKESKTRKEQQEYLKKKEAQGITRPPKEYQVSIKFPEALTLGRPVLEVRDVSFGYSSDKLIFKNLNAGINILPYQPPNITISEFLFKILRLLI